MLLWLVLVFEVSVRQRVLFVFAFPEDGHHPPTLAVIHQLNAVDAALKRLRIVFIVTRFVGAEDVRDITLCVNSAFSAPLR